MKITDKGIVEKTGVIGYTEIFSSVFQTIFGEKINLGDYTLQKQMIILLANVFDKGEDGVVYLYNCLSPYTASGVALINILSPLGIKRKPATQGILKCTITGKANTIINAGYKIRSKDDLIFILQNNVIIPTSGSIETNFISEKAGLFKIKASEVSLSIDNVIGVQNVRNVTEQEIGTNAETDFEILKTLESRLYKNTIGYNQSVINALLNVPLVNKCYVVENQGDASAFISDNGSVVSSDTGVAILPHSIHVFVDDGVKDTVNRHIFETKGHGINTNGSESSDMPFSAPIKHSLLIKKDIKIELSIKKDLSYSDDTKELIQDALIKYVFDNVHNILYKEDLYSVVKQFTGFRITTFTLKDNTDASADVVTYKFNELVNLPKANIDITVIV